MFSSAVRKSSYSAVKDQSLAESSPVTPFVRGGRKLFEENPPVPGRPQTGTPAPWASPRLSVLARNPPGKKSENSDEKDSVKPVYVGDFPQALCKEQANLLRTHVPGQAFIAGGMDKGTALSWIVCGSRLFLWSYLSPAASKNCVTLDIPPSLLPTTDVHKVPSQENMWLLCVVSRDGARDKGFSSRQLDSAGLLLCNQKNRAVAYWSEINKDGVTAPAISLASPEELGVGSSPMQERCPHSAQELSMKESNQTGFNSFIASRVADDHHVCVALASSCNGELWQFHCSPSDIYRKKVNLDIMSSPSLYSEIVQPAGSEGYPRSLTWRSALSPIEESCREFFLLTAHEVQCYTMQLSSNYDVSKLWSHEMIGSDGDLGIKKDLAGQKRIWPLDIQVDELGKEITILVATFCKDRATGSGYTQYSLLAMRYKSGLDLLGAANLNRQRVLEKKSPLEVIIPKARVEEEKLLFSMRLRVGGKPSGSAVILSSDGVATVSFHWGNSTKLYQFDLPYDAGKVLDACVLPSTGDGEEGSWVVLTERAGVWAIPAKAVLLGGVDPAERSLSRKGSSKEESSKKEKRPSFVRADTLTLRSNPEASSPGDAQKTAFNGIARRNAHDEEADSLVSHLFHEFLLSGVVNGAHAKLIKSGAFERDGETNAFARLSKSIVDTLAKHWTTTRGAEIVALTVMSTQLMEKQQKHQKFLQFLALTNCHEELCLRQRYALQIIMEHGEKLSSMIELRELQNIVNQNRSDREVSGALWDLIQVVGERARRTTVLLMDRDNAEVFYSKVSNLEEVFYCLEKQLHYIIGGEQPLKVQVQRGCELVQACATLLHTASNYKNRYHMWYPAPDGLTSWYGQRVVRNGIWSIVSFMIKILNEYEIDLSVKSDICSHLEVLADIFLEAYVGVITAKVDCGEEHRSLIDEYHERRDILLNSLYKQMKFFVEARSQDSGHNTEEEKEKFLRELSSNLLSIARRHEAYQTLWKLCCDLNDSALLKSLMHESMGPKGGFSYYVFQQLHEGKQFSKLLRLGEEFPDVLASFLKDHPDLDWLHALYMHRFSSASQTLHFLALSEDSDASKAHAQQETEPGNACMELTLAERKRFLYLSKIAAVAGRASEYEKEVEYIDADLRILKLQEEIVKLASFEDDGEKQRAGNHLLTPGDLIRLCLKGQQQTSDLLLKAFEVFAWTSSSFRKQNKSLLVDCWRNAIDQDDWEKLYQFSVAEGWSDEDALSSLEKTTLFKVSRRCYAPSAESLEGGFEETLPLRQDEAMVSATNSRFFEDSSFSCSSVEEILMQHRDFSVAGKLMLTAVMLGSVRNDIMVVVDGPVPME